MIGDGFLNRKHAKRESYNTHPRPLVFSVEILKYIGTGGRVVHQGGWLGCTLLF